MKKNQLQKAIAYLNHGWLSSLKAVQLFGCTRLSARILDLRKMGVKIEDRWVVDHGKHWKEYRLKKDTVK